MAENTRDTNDWIKEPIQAHTQAYKDGYKHGYSAGRVHSVVKVLRVLFADLTPEQVEKAIQTWKDEL